MRVSGRGLRARWLPVTSALVLAALAVATVPASADEIGTQVVQEARDIATGPTNVPYNTSGTLLLDHFFFRDVNDDQHLKVMEVRPASGRLYVAFSDESLDEQFEYRVAHQRVTWTGLVRGRVVNNSCRRMCATNLTKPAGDYVFILAGFRFEFTGGDHHIDQIGIEEHEGRLVHYFNDKNDDDEYRATIDYVWVPRSRFSVVDRFLGNVEGDDSFTWTTDPGDKVIRGFFFGYGADNYDNHIKRIGVLTYSGQTDIYFGDKDPGDSEDWIYIARYGILS